MKRSHSPSRRHFLKIAATAGAGFAIGIQLSACTDSNKQPSDKNLTEEFIPNIWIEILKDNRIICFFAEAEMGQAVSTSLPLILAEELGADWNLVEVRHAPITTPYGEQSTGDSTSIRENWQPLQKAGAMARQMLIEAAKQYYNAPAGIFDTENSWIINQQSGERIEFGTVVSIAQKLPLPVTVELRSPETYKLIGLSPMPKFSKEKVTGELIYASDIHLPGMIYATIVHPPVFGSKYLAHDDKDAKTLTEYINAFPINEGLAVIATNTWAAFKAADLIKITWSDSIHNKLSSEDIYSEMELAGTQPGKPLTVVGESEESVLSASVTTIENVYTTPFQAHATMEPMCCVAHIHDGICEVWAPTQSPTYAKLLVGDIHNGLLHRVLAKIRGIFGEDNDANSNIIMHPQFLGGGFGRRLKNDYVTECVQIAKRIKSPVKLQWTREQDIRHDYYRATSRHQMKAILDKTTSQINHWSQKIISPSISDIDIPYSFESMSISAIAIKTPVPLGPWRSVDNSNNIYALECFIDEIAYELSMDPIQLRIRLLDKEPRLKHVLLEANKKATQRKKGNNALGCAVFKGYGSFIALLTEIGVKNNNPEIVRMTAIVDCGQIIDPDQSKSQVEGGLIFALTAATRSEITIERSRVYQDNFDNFPLLRLTETPEFDISFIDSINPPGGLGEVPVPPVAPSIYNAAKALSHRS
jgi:CO/xanthine dehydrogenase Mo-binding subunit